MRLSAMIGGIAKRRSSSKISFPSLLLFGLIQCLLEYLCWCGPHDFFGSQIRIPFFVCLDDLPAKPSAYIARRRFLGKDIRKGRLANIGLNSRRINGIKSLILYNITPV